MLSLPSVSALDTEWTRLSDLRFEAAPFEAVRAAEVLDSVARDPDTVLLALVACAVEGDHLAGRTVVQALLGKLVRMSVADARLPFDDLLAALWLRIRAYPVGRRQRSVAANLVLDARKDVLSERRGLCVVPLTDPNDPCDEPTACDLLDAARGLGLIDDRSRAILGSVYDDGLGSAAAADRHGTTATAVRWRCSRDLRRMAARASDLWEAIA